MKLPSAKAFFIDTVAVLITVALFLWPPVDTLGLVGAALAMGAIWLTLYLWMRVRHVSEDERSLNEQLAGLGFVFVAVITAMFFWQLHALGWQTNLVVSLGIGKNAFMMLVGFWIFSAIVTDQHKRLLGTRGEPLEDERDTAIRNKAYYHGYSLLVIAVVALIIHLGFNPTVKTYATPINVAHWLIGILMISTLIENGSMLWQYRATSAEPADQEIRPA